MSTSWIVAFANFDRRSVISCTWLPIMESSWSFQFVRCRSSLFLVKTRFQLTLKFPCNEVFYDTVSPPKRSTIQLFLVVVDSSVSFFSVYAVNGFLVLYLWWIQRKLDTLLLWAPRRLLRLHRLTSKLFFHSVGKKNCNSNHWIYKFIVVIFLFIVWRYPLSKCSILLLFITVCMQFSC